ncbi:LuxR C-terminal-related transcriptional regulator [Streptomyces sp. NPDC048479]|uniref:LuxR C-terminal-related transcriptional regulator n=1 Tax=Streptomyces sp. NPDC048479 TaxID=3154725 RepID=UPI003423869F
MPRSTTSAALDGGGAPRTARTPSVHTSGIGITESQLQLAPTGDPLLAAKFSVPSVPGTFVRRKRLLDRLTDGTAGPLTLITGPAGAGKTMLAASWAVGATAPHPAVVWLTLEDDDGAPGVFWTYVLEAFRHHHVTLPDTVGSPTRADNVDRSLLVRLASALARLDQPVVLVLDGLDQVPDREVASGLDFILNHAGPQLRLVLISRVDPLLPLHRYRAEDSICEIRGADLAFTRHETATLLRRHGLVSSAETVDALTRRSEGWAAGLRLCALAMQRSDDPTGFARSFALSQSAVADYLLAEVVEAQPAATQDLLVRTSILNRVHPQLANLLTGREDAEGILAGLTRANTFVEPIGDTPWCRFHPLFTEVLHAHLRSHQPGLEPQLHRLAARWFADAGLVSEAMEHAAAAEDWECAAALIVDHLALGGGLTGPDNHRLERLFAGMPADLPGAAPWLRHLLEQRPELTSGHPWRIERTASADGTPALDCTATLNGTAALDGGPAQAIVVESLSDRECDVLRLAAEMMSTEEIAAELYVSVNTVKTHLRSIYRKLSVSRRSDAVRRARELHLL